jgi:hypothetical protein
MQNWKFGWSQVNEQNGLVFKMCNGQRFITIGWKKCYKWLKNIWLKKWSNHGNWET